MQLHSPKNQEGTVYFFRKTTPNLVYGPHRDQRLLTQNHIILQQVKRCLKSYHKIYYHIKHPKAVENIKYYLASDLKNNKYIRAREESFAECFGFIGRWITEGFDNFDFYIINKRNSRERIIIKTLMPMLQWMLKNIDWELIYTNKRIVRNRIQQIKAFLSKVESIPLKHNDSLPNKFKFKTNRRLM